MVIIKTTEIKCSKDFDLRIKSFWKLTQDRWLARSCGSKETKQSKSLLVLYWCICWE